MAGFFVFRLGRSDRFREAMRDSVRSCIWGLIWEKLPVPRVFFIPLLAGLLALAWPVRTAEPRPGAESLPKMGRVPEYAGSSNCRDCHKDQHASWHRSYHRTMTQLPVREAVKADFSGVTLTNAGVRFTMLERSNQFWVRMERPLEAVPGGADPSAEFPIGLVTGSHHMQVFWIGNEEANCQIGFPFTWLIPERRWVPRNATFIRPPHAPHRPETWNQVCARCHSTAPQPNLDRGARRWSTEVEELGISCEACHGPGERHAALERELAKQQPRPKVELTHIIQPEKLSPVRASQICGYCHSMKWWEGAQSWPVREFTYRPGDDLEATTPIIRPKEIERQPWLKNVLAKNPDLFADFFWPDGMVRVSGRDYNGLIESPCYKGGKFSCLSCHSMHESEPASQLGRERNDQRACLQCHSKFGTERELSAHTHHKSGSPGSDCYNCHMPHTSYGVLKAIRSHQISSPRVEVQRSSGRPNACNLCHLDKTLAWTAEALSKWHGHPKPALTEHENRVADSVRLGLSGDAGQRVLLAWHLGWEPAVGVSGKDWIPPVLGQLLEDPYSAVRCVAERSLKRLDLGWVPRGYDFSAEPGGVPSPGVEVMVRWMARRDAALRPPEATQVGGDMQTMADRFRKLVSGRNGRDVRLRE